MALSSTQRNAFLKAVKVRGWESVTRLDYGRYLVRSATSTATYIVTGTAREGHDHTCSCEAALRGRYCWHKAAVVMARQRCEWFKAKAAQATATFRINGQTFTGQGRNVLDALGHAQAA